MELHDWSCTSFSCTRNVDTSKKNSYDRINIGSSSTSPSLSKISSASVPRWRSLWRKMKKEKIRKMFVCGTCSSSSARVHYFAYDPYDYSQNFDDKGPMWSDPDTMSRSFSARFAVPCRVFEDGATMVAA